MKALYVFGEKSIGLSNIDPEVIIDFTAGNKALADEFRKSRKQKGFYKFSPERIEQRRVTVMGSLERRVNDPDFILQTALQSAHQLKSVIREEIDIAVKELPDKPTLEDICPLLSLDSKLRHAKAQIRFFSALDIYDK